MQEHFSADALMAPIPESEDPLSLMGTPKMQEHFSAGASMAHI